MPVGHLDSMHSTMEPLFASSPKLEDLEQLHNELFLHICQKHGSAAAVRILGKALLGIPNLVSASSLEQADSLESRDSLDVTAEPESPVSSTGEPDEKLHSRWIKGVALAHGKVDPWASRRIHRLPMEHCKRHRYDPHGESWVVDDVLVKMEVKPFAAGAMRECYAMKKLSTFCTSVFRDWKRAQNFVAKRYKKAGVPRPAYFTDAVMQMDAKLLGEEYNKTEPPKKVDMVQVAVVEFLERPSNPVYCIEQLIEGDYIKYNSNSGYVAAQDDVLRHTPQAFSHFTFELTRGAKLCVDVQGVGDLYTDPQIHTLDATEYGDGNLGLRGMALFFRTHECNPLCMRLQLTPFARCEPDVRQQGYQSSDSSTGAGTVSRSFLRRRSLMDRMNAARAAQHRAKPKMGLEELRKELKSVPMEASVAAHVHVEVARLYAEATLLPDVRCGGAGDAADDPMDALAGGLFHLQRAAAMGEVLACTVLARAHLGMEPSIPVIAHLLRSARLAGLFEEHHVLALRYATLAAERGVRAAAAAVGEAQLSTQGLGEGVLSEPDGAAALRWLTQAAGLQGGSDDAHSYRHLFYLQAEEEAQGLPGGSLCSYELLALMAEIYVAGSAGVTRNPARAAEYYTSAAELAAASFKGKLASRYYEMAARAEAAVDEDEGGQEDDGHQNGDKERQ